ALEKPRLRLIRPGLARLTPVTVPAFTRPRVRDVSNAFVRRTIRAAVRTLGVRPRAMIAGTPLPVLGAAPADLNVYYATDDFVTGAALMGLDAGWLEQQVQRQLAAADKVLAVSEDYARRCREQGHDAVFVPNGCDARAFADTDSAPWPDDVRLPGPVVGFVGYLTSRIELSYLEAIADRGMSLLLVGSRQLTFDRRRIDPLLARPNVQWVGPKSFAELPSYLRAIDVGIVPYADTAFNRASFPLKTLEYLAAGRDVVATDLPSIRWLDTDLVTVRTDAAEFAEAVQRATERVRTPAVVAARQRFAAGHSWERRTETIAGILGLAP
ncbi:MAG TPA: glycosyltransferase, partial [Mycobacteriales bacterium]|nr:glycosyltransferase [Mycobacteriales bacterium]